MIRKLSSLLILTAFLLISSVGFSVEPAVDSHPIFAEQNWIKDFSHTYFCDIGMETICSIVEYYNSRNPNFSMAVHTIFGDKVQKNYVEYDPVTGRVFSHWAQVENGGIWYTARVERPKWQVVKDSFGKVIAIIVVLEDENGKEIVRREVKRKDVAPAVISEKEKQLIDKWIQDNNLNLDGGPKRERSGPTSMFHDRTGKTTDRYEYILKNNPDRPWFRN